jgi:cation:H+ antiporter
MLLDLLYIVASLVMLYFGAEWLVKGSSSFALRVGMSPLLIGLTIVAFGTSTPELLVSISASLAGNSGIALGNVVGSNVFNICVILGVSALVYPLTVRSQIIKIDSPVMIGTSLLCWGFFTDGELARWEGLLLLFIAITYTVINIRLSKVEKPEVKEEYAEEIPGMLKNGFYDAGFMILGLAVLMAGSKLLVMGAVHMATEFGVSQEVIGLTIVAAGTSMPELATSVIATMKKESDIAIGNVVGSNIYNILLILGTAGGIAPLQAGTIGTIDMAVMCGTAALLVLLMRTGFSLKRWEGAVLLAIYGGYLWYLWPK